MPESNSLDKSLKSKRQVIQVLPAEKSMENKIALRNWTLNHDVQSISSFWYQQRSYYTANLNEV